MSCPQPGLSGRFSAPGRRPTPASIRLFALAAALASLPAAVPAARGQAATLAGVPRPMSIGEVGQGTLLFATKTPGRFLPAPLVATEVDMRVSGMVARVVVRQQFHNPTGSWLEGVYAFPLPENASVDRMRLRVGDQAIEAHIAKRGEARRTYAAARRQGRRAALVEQQRPNIFTSAVANIGPGQAVTVELRYQHGARYDDGQFRLRFPMVVAPRYIPGPLITASAGPAGWAGERQTVADANAITSPVLRPEAGAINPVTLHILLDAGFPLAALESPHHAIVAAGWRDGTTEITLAGRAVPADRDFELVWTPETGKAPLAGLFRETVNGETYLLVMVLPPHDRGDDRVGPPRDAVFVLDRSGSMAGGSIRQAKQALGLALDRLRPVDRFDIIRFAGGHDSLFGGLHPVGAETLRRARAFLEATDAEGGTNMLPALHRALLGGAARGRLRQVVFLTDGAVGNEVRLFREIRDRLNGSRLFTVGIGSAPNGYFMRKAAEAGRGSYVHIGNLSQVKDRMDGLFRKLERAVMTDLLTRWSAAGDTALAVDAYPRLPPDLYYGEPLVLAARLQGLAAPPAGAALHVTGILAGRQWRHAMPLAGARPAEGIAALWGRARIADLTDSLSEGADPAAVRAAVIETALRHRLVSRYTSLVAVSERIARAGGTPLISRKVPLNLPHGWNYDKVFGELGLKTSPVPQQEARLTHPAVAAGGSPVALPRGASPARLHMLIGLAALIAAAAIVLLRLRAA